MKVSEEQRGAASTLHKPATTSRKKETNSDKESKRIVKTGLQAFECELSLSEYD